jgi:hypothetical protein
MNAKFEPNGEVRNLLRAGAEILPSCTERGAKNVPASEWQAQHRSDGCRRDPQSYIPEDMGSLMKLDIGGQIKAAAVDSDFENDGLSVDLGSQKGEEMSNIIALQRAAEGQQMLTQFFKPVQIKADHDEDSDESIMMIDDSDDSDDSDHESDQEAEFIKAVSAMGNFLGTKSFSNTELLAISGRAEFFVEDASGWMSGKPVPGYIIPTCLTKEQYLAGVSTNSDFTSDCTCCSGRFTVECTRCQQCPDCCNCMEQHSRMILECGLDQEIDSSDHKNDEEPVQDFQQARRR